MQDITNVGLQPLQGSIYIHPVTIHYTLNHKTRTADVVLNKDCVAIIIYNTTKNELVLIKQFRPVRYFSGIAREDRNGKIDLRKYPPQSGIALELCAGITDKKLSIEEIAIEEMLEECGYEVKVSCLEKIHSCPVDEYSTTIAHIYYCEVTDDMRVSKGGGTCNELIEVINMTLEQIRECLLENKFSAHPSLLYCFYWFLENKCGTLKLK